MTKMDPNYLVGFNLSLHNFFRMMFFIQSAFNPIVYAIRFKPFTVAFKLMFGIIREDDRAEAISDASV